MMYEILYADDVVDELLGLSARDRSIVVDRIKEQLRSEPAKATRAKKLITGLKSPWAIGHAIWQLRVREHRVYYDVDEDQQQVTVRAIRRKPPHAITEQIV